MQTIDSEMVQDFAAFKQFPSGVGIGQLTMDPVSAAETLQNILFNEN